MSTLENELARIRPLLTMHATILRDSELWRSEALSDLVTDRLASFGKKLKGKERAAAPPDSAHPLPNGRADDPRDDPRCKYTLGTVSSTSPNERSATYGRGWNRLEPSRSLQL